MEILERFFVPNKEAVYEMEPQVPIAPQKPLGLQVLFPGMLALDTEKLTGALRSYHPSLAQAVFEINPTYIRSGATFGAAKWDSHVVSLVGFNAPMPLPMVERCLGPAHYPEEVKKQARAHQSHVFLDYQGSEPSPLEQYAALATAAGALVSVGALVVLNESAHTSLPASTLTFGGAAGDRLALLRVLPIPILYSGFVEAAAEEGVWMRTYGNHLLALPDLAFLAQSHQEGDGVLEVFSGVCRYLVNSGAALRPGHTMQVAPMVFIRVRAPRANEYFLRSEAEMLVVERIAKSQINRPG